VRRTIRDEGKSALRLTLRNQDGSGTDEGIKRGFRACSIRRGLPMSPSEVPTPEFATSGRPIAKVTNTQQSDEHSAPIYSFGGQKPSIIV
jgi:hypothetical protein